MRDFARAVLAMLMLYAVCIVPSHAKTVQFGDDNIAAELAAENLPKAGEVWMLALHFTPQSREWHGYWSNPGDAGQGMALEWQLPDGWEAGEPIYPMPQRLLISGLMNHVYEGEYTVLVPVKVPAGADVSQAGAVALYANYLACTDRICVPQDAALTIDPNNAVSDPRFAAWRAAIVPQLDQSATYEIDGEHLRISIPLPASLALDNPHVFLKTSDLGGGSQPLYAKAQRFYRKGDRLIAQIPLQQLQLPEGSPLLKAPAPEQIEGILSLSGSGIAGSGIAGAEGAGTQGVRFAAQAADVSLSAAEPVAVMGTAGAGATPPLWSLILAALLGGLMLNILPCVFPILSLKALALAKAGGDEADAKRDALAYTAGVVLACAGLGVAMLALRSAGEAVGWAFQLQEPRIVALLFLLAAALTANFLGLFEIPGLSFSSQGAGQGTGQSKGRTSSFVTGLLAAFVATPCTGPFMAAALGAALILPWLEALVLFICLGLGLALPFLLLGFMPALRRHLPKPGPWMETFRRWMALPMGLTLLALAWLLWRLGGWTYLAMVAAPAVALLLLLAAYGRVQHAPHSDNHKGSWLKVTVPALIFVALALMPSPAPQATSANESLLDPAPYSPQTLAQARASGRPVFLWFTADWCVTCKVNEQVAIEREETRQAFEQAGVITLRGDWSRPDAAITAFLTEQGVAGVPLYIWYPPDAGDGAKEGAKEGAQKGQQLPQILTPDALIDLAEDQTQE